jgi:hypothetical protein
MAAYLREGHQEYLSFFGDKSPVWTTGRRHRVG